MKFSPRLNHYYLLGNGNIIQYLGPNKAKSIYVKESGHYNTVGSIMKYNFKGYKIIADLGSNPKAVKALYA